MTWNEDAEKWIELARDGHDPHAADTQRVRRALIARGVIVAGSVATTAGAAAAATTVKALVVQASAALLVAGSMATASALLFDAGPSVPSSSRPAHSAVARASSAARAANTPPSVDQESRLDEAPGNGVDQPRTAASSKPPSQFLRPITDSASRSPAARARASEGSEGAPGLEREIAGLRSAQRALHRGETESAARALDELEATNPDGALLEERLATRTILACSSGSAPVELRRFLERYPTSVHRERVRAACARKPAVGRFPETGSSGHDH